MAPRNGGGIPTLLDTMSLVTVLKGDVNDDSFVDNLDITPFIAAVAAADQAAFLTVLPEGNYAAADVDRSGSPDHLDIAPSMGLLTSAASTAGSISEPATLLILAASRLTMARKCRTKGASGLTSS